MTFSTDLDGTGARARPEMEDGTAGRCSVGATVRRVCGGWVVRWAVRWVARWVVRRCAARCWAVCACSPGPVPRGGGPGLLRRDSRPVQRGRELRSPAGGRYWRPLLLCDSPESGLLPLRLLGRRLKPQFGHKQSRKCTNQRAKSSNAPQIVQCGTVSAVLVEPSGKRRKKEKEEEKKAGPNDIIVPRAC